MHNPKFVPSTIPHARIDETVVLGLLERVEEQVRQLLFIVFPEPVDRRVVRRVQREEASRSDRVLEQSFDLPGGPEASTIPIDNQTNHLARITRRTSHVVGTIPVHDRGEIVVGQGVINEDNQVIVSDKIEEILVQKRNKRLV